MDRYRAWDSAIPERWTIPARGNSQFLGGGPFPPVGICDSGAMDRSRTRKSAIPERWTIPTRKNTQFLSDGCLNAGVIIVCGRYSGKIYDYSYFLQSLSCFRMFDHGKIYK